MTHALLALLLCLPECCILPWVKPMVMRLAVMDEVIDPGDAGWMLDNWHCSQSYGTWDYLQEAFAEVQDCPHLCEAYRWPDRDTVCVWRDFNRRACYQVELNAMLYPQRAEAFRDIVAKLDERFAMFDHLLDAKATCLPLRKRRLALQEFRDMVGEWRWLAGVVPFAIPEEMVSIP